MKPQPVQQTVFATISCEIESELPSCYIVRQGKWLIRLPKRKISKIWRVAAQTFMKVEDLFCLDLGIRELA